MAFSSVVRTLGRTALTQELTSSLERDGRLQLDGVPRFPKGLMVSALAHQRQQHLCLIAATLEEAGRWAAQLQEMDWPLVHFYPTSEASPYDDSDSDEITWGQLQVLADLVHPTAPESPRCAIVATQRALQPHLPPPEHFAQSCLPLKLGLELSLSQLKRQLAELGYESVSLVEAEGQWSRRGDIIDIFPRCR